MAEHWVALLAAVVGLLAAMGGAAVGGYIANKGQEQRLEQERAAEIRDLRIATYVKFLEAIEREHFEAAKTPDRLVRTAEAEVALVAPTSEVRRAAGRLTTNALFGATETEYRRLRDRFIESAQADIGIRD